MSKVYAVGYYDEDGVFFYLWERCRPDEHYCYSLAAPAQDYVLRIEGQPEQVVSREEAYACIADHLDLCDPSDCVD